MKIKTNDKKQDSNLNVKNLELIRPSRMASAILSDKAYVECLTDFESMAASNGGRFTSQLGQCQLAIARHEGFARFTLRRNNSEPIGEARLIWSQYHLNELGISLALRGLLLSGQGISCLLVILGQEFETNTTSKEINLALHALAAAAFGLLRHLHKKPAIITVKKPLSLPSSDLPASQLGKKETSSPELFDLANHLFHLEQTNKPLFQQL